MISISQYLSDRELDQVMQIVTIALDREGITDDFELSINAYLSED